MTRPFPELEAKQIMLQLLEGLDFMHSNGFAHRDLKPQVLPHTNIVPSVSILCLTLQKNIFVQSTGPDWWVKIGDFGISKRVLEGLTGLQTLNGTPAFMAPEVYQQIWESSQGKQESDLDFTPEVDVWSLGVITYYLLSGKLLFSGQSDLLAYYKWEAGLPLESVAQHRVSPDASMFLGKTLAATPAERLTARDALDHAWLVPLLQDSDPEGDQPTSTINNTKGVPSPPATKPTKFPRRDTLGHNQPERRTKNTKHPRPAHRIIPKKPQSRNRHLQTNHRTDYTLPQPQPPSPQPSLRRSLNRPLTRKRIINITTTTHPTNFPSLLLQHVPYRHTAAVYTPPIRCSANSNLGFRVPHAEVWESGFERAE